MRGPIAFSKSRKISLSYFSILKLLFFFILTICKQFSI